LEVVTSDPEIAVEALLRPFSLDSIASALAQLTIQRLTDEELFRKNIERAGWDPNVTFRPVSLRRLLRSAIKGRELPDKAIKSISVRALKAAEDALHDVLPLADHETEKSIEGIHAMALRSLQMQYADQLGMYHFAKEVALCVQTIDLAAASGIDLDAAFREAFGCTFADITFMCFAIFAAMAAKRDAFFIAADFNRNNEMRNLPDEVIGAFWAHCSMTYSEYKTRASDASVSIPGYEPYSLSPLVKWPLLTRSDGSAVAPIAGDVLHRVGAASNSIPCTRSGLSSPTTMASCCEQSVRLTNGMWGTP
jgi:hypothetical protein